MSLSGDAGVPSSWWGRQDRIARLFIIGLTVLVLVLILVVWRLATSGSCYLRWGLISPPPISSIRRR